MTSGGNVSAPQLIHRGPEQHIGAARAAVRTEMRIAGLHQRECRQLVLEPHLVELRRSHDIARVSPVAGVDAIDIAIDPTLRQTLDPEQPVEHDLQTWIPSMFRRCGGPKHDPRRSGTEPVKDELLGTNAGVQRVLFAQVEEMRAGGGIEYFQVMGTEDTPFVLLHPCDLFLDFLGKVQIVPLEATEVLATTSPKGTTGIRVDPRDAGVHLSRQRDDPIGMALRVRVNHLRRAVGRAIVGHDDLDIRVRLRERAVERLPDKAHVLIRRHHDRDERPAHGRPLDFVMRAYRRRLTPVRAPALCQAIDSPETPGRRMELSQRKMIHP